MVRRFWLPKKMFIITRDFRSQLLNYGKSTHIIKSVSLLIRICCRNVRNCNVVSSIKKFSHICNNSVDFHSKGKLLPFWQPQKKSYKLFQKYNQNADNVELELLEVYHPRVKQDGQMDFNEALDQKLLILILVFNQTMTPG